MIGPHTTAAAWRCMLDERLVTYLPIVRATAGRISRRVPGVDVDDAMQDGWIGLHDAVRTFREGGTTFAAHAKTRIAGAIYDGIRGRSWSTRTQLRKGRPARVVELKMNEVDPRSDWATAIADSRMDAEDILSRLPAKPRRIVRDRAIRERSFESMATEAGRTIATVKNDYWAGMRSIRHQQGTTP